MMQFAADATMDMDGVRVFGPHVRGRSCGSCTACCTQVPVVLDDEHKPANTRCKHLCSKGCRVYARRPDACQVWSCRWLFDADTAELRRPDQSGYVIDCAPDHVVLRNDATGEGRPILVLQVWVDPARRDAHRDPALRRYLATMGERHGMMAIVRWSSSDGMVLIPPCMNDTGGWVEHSSTMNTAGVMAERLRAAGVDASLYDEAELRVLARPATARLLQRAGVNPGDVL